MNKPARRRPLSPLSPPDPLLAELRAASERGERLLPAALRQIEQRSQLSQWATLTLLALAVGAGLLLHWWHPEWFQWQGTFPFFRRWISLLSSIPFPRVACETDNC